MKACWFIHKTNFASAERTTKNRQPRCEDVTNQTNLSLILRCRGTSCSRLGRRSGTGELRRLSGSGEARLRGGLGEGRQPPSGDTPLRGGLGECCRRVGDCHLRGSGVRERRRRRGEGLRRRGGSIAGDGDRWRCMGRL